ncbi:MAG: hypothetical protein H7301_06575 [Cryobacterium sp.]|nr:hypothetical protein [Oligoflexia bacterium]
MPRKYAVLRTFTTDVERLLREAETSFAILRDAGPSASVHQLSAVYRPIHSLKGICGMVGEARLLVKAFHLFEEGLPPLLPVRNARAPSQAEWVQLGETTFEMVREVLRVLRSKLELWERLGADAHDSKGLIVAFHCESKTVKLWVPITVLFGLVSDAELSADSDLVQTVVGASEEFLLIEAVNGPVALGFTEIIATGTRLDALHLGVSTSFKEWWHLFHKRTVSSSEAA